ncbi:MAG: tRNA (adenosine(37)-N6)-dimethylallyltransferase MiaA [Deferribacteraceae bacterium]|jgi:tRNA dimethylallyltransferase|nr:tRNA (adenosine(37)-N6)-dimethylallyltransferase MiaA [Deferribacteraceae bacterium]
MNISLIPIITGATSTGKSEIVYSFLEDHPEYELVSADAFQVYKGLNIGTAKPAAEILSRFSHHLIDILEHNQTYSAGSFVEDAEQAIGDILSRGKLPIVVGGTGLYIECLRNGIFKQPICPPELRVSILSASKEDLYAELVKVDPVSAAKINPNDKVRIARAVEVYRAAGAPISEAHKLFRGEAKFNYKLFIIEKDRERLYRDINLRTEKMLKSGWLDEVEELMKIGGSSSSPAFRAIGYKELAAVLEGALALEKAKELIAQKTRNFAKRQLTWFRRLQGAIFVKRDEMPPLIRQF